MSMRCVNVSLQKYILGSASIDFYLRLSLCAAGPPARPGKALDLQAHPVFGGVPGFLPVVLNFDRFGPEHPKFLPDIPFKISS